MLRVWVDRRPVGVLDRAGRHGTSFAYDPAASPNDVVSLTMPHQVASYNSISSLLPIFDMNLPEGALRERLTLGFRKATGTFDDLDLLGIVGRSQIGRVRLSSMEGQPDVDVPFESVDDLLRARRGGDLLDYMMDRYASMSGLSGVQPKAMFRGVERDIRELPSVKGATHVVKFWKANEYPELAANEFFCMSAAKAAGIEVPPFSLSDTGDALVVERFDRVDNRFLGFEDFCVLNAVTAREKYKGGYETKLFRRAKDFLPSEGRRKGMVDLFRLFALNCVVRNGDAHLKNFGILYEGAPQRVRLSPAYDIVTTVAYVPRDAMALTLNGSTDWPDRKRLLALAQSRADLTPKEANAVLEQVADAVCDIAHEAATYFRTSSAPDVGEKMLAAWDVGVRKSLGLDDRTVVQGGALQGP